MHDDSGSPAGSGSRVVLVATDFSPSADTAIHWGTRVARAHGWRLLLVHSIPLQGPASDFLPSPPDLDEELHDMAMARLSEAAAEPGRQGVAVETRLALGIPSQGVLEVAREVAPELLVAGSRGHAKLAHLLLGSTAQRIVQHAPCPVLTVHADDHHRHPRVRTVLVPTDFSHDAHRAAHAARHLLSVVESARLVLLHAYHLPLEYTAYGTIPTGLRFRDDVAGVAEQKLEELAAELRREGLDISSRVAEGYPPEVILRTAEEIGAGLIAMGSHGKSGLAHLLLGSTAERVVQQSPCPVLTVRG